jgi:hypothetical protein
MPEMRVLSDQELAQLSSLDHALYDVLPGTIEKHPAAAFLAEDESGFFFLGVDVMQDDPDLVEFRLRFRPEGWPGVYGNFNPCPDGIHFYFDTSTSIRAQPDRSAMWPMLLKDYPDESAFIEAASEFIDDWLTGQTRLEIVAANGAPYKWTVRRRGRELWSRRSLLYPFWGKKTLTVRACGTGTRDSVHS